MALKVAEVLIRWRQQGSQDVEASAKRMGQSLTDLGDKAKTAGAVLSAGLTAPLLLIGKQAVDAASDLNEAMSATNTVFGSTADQVVRFSRTAASQLGQSQQAALAAASGMGALFKGVGLTEQQMADFSTSLLTAAADLGSFYNVDPGQALDKLRSGLVGEVEGLRQFGILLNADAVEAKGLAMGLGDVNGELSEGEKVQARYALIMEQVGAAQGDFARTSDGLANSQRILSARLQDIRAEIGTYLLPYALQLSGVFSQLLDRFLSLDERSKGLAVAIGAVAAAAGPALLIFGQVASTAGKLLPVLTAMTGPIALVIAAVAGLAFAFNKDFLGIRTALEPIIDGVGETLTRMVRFFQAAKDRGLTPFRLAFRTLIVSLSEKLDDDHPAVMFLRGILRNGEKLAGWITQTGIPKVQEFFKLFSQGDFEGAGDIFGSLLEDVKGGWDKTVGAWIEEQKGQALTLGATFIQNLANSFAGLNWDVIDTEGLKAKGGDLLGGLASGAREAFDTRLVPAFRAGFLALTFWLSNDGLPTVVERLVTGGADLIGGLIKGLWDHRQQVWDFFSQTLIPGVVGAMILAPTLLVAAGVGLIRGLLGGASQIWNTQLGPWFEERKTAVQNLFATAVEWLTGSGATLISGLQNGVQNYWDNTIKPWFDGIQQSFIGFFGPNPETWLSDTGGKLLDGLRHGIQDYWNNTLMPWMGGMKQSFISFFPDAGKWLFETGSALIQGLWDGAKAKWDEFTLWLDSLKPTLPNIGGGETVTNGGTRGSRGGARNGDQLEAHAFGGALSKRYTLVGEYGPELLINKQLVMPHGASMSRLAAMGGMANGGTMWGAWLAEQDRGTRDLVRAMRGAGTLTAANRRQMMGNIRITEDGSIVPASFYRDREPAATRRARLQHERNSDALNRANDYGDRTGDYSRRDRVLAREARNGTLADGGLSRQEREYIINNYGSINVYADDPNVGRKIAETISTRRR